MAWRPWNLVLRFALELAALAAFGAWGWHAGGGLARAPLAAVCVALPAFAWGAFRVPNDGGKPLVTIPGRIRLALEAVFFAGAVLALAGAGHRSLALLLAAVTAAHYGVSWDRVALLARNRPLPAQAHPFGARRRA